MLSRIFKAFPGPFLFVLILEKRWDLRANINCHEIPDYLVRGGDFAIPLQAFEAFSCSAEKANFAAFPRQCFPRSVIVQICHPSTEKGLKGRLERDFSPGHEVTGKVGMALS